MDQEDCLTCSARYQSGACRASFSGHLCEEAGRLEGRKRGVRQYIIWNYRTCGLLESGEMGLFESCWDLEDHNLLI